MGPKVKASAKREGTIRLWETEEKKMGRLQKLAKQSPTRKKREYKKKWPTNHRRAERPGNTGKKELANNLSATRGKGRNEPESKLERGQRRLREMSGAKNRTTTTNKRDEREKGGSPKLQDSKTERKGADESFQEKNSKENRHRQKSIWENNLQWAAQTFEGKMKEGGQNRLGSDKRGALYDLLQPRGGDLRQ